MFSGAYHMERTGNNKRERIDKLLIERGLAPSRAKAQALVMAGAVLADEQRVEKPAQEFAPDVNIRLKTGAYDTRYVGRGGLKLQHALLEFGVNPAGFVCLDVGSSTGGFTDCLLQRGAERVFAIDSGTNQLDWKLRSDARVDARENTNARYLQPGDFPGQFDLIVMDVSFISVTKIFPALAALLKPTGQMIVLIKPQFEVGKGEVGKGGIVREPEKHERVIVAVNAAASQCGFINERIIDSPITGADGNHEFLGLYRSIGR
jgi:23S rRNA (cytidine1920-2'-O)/16S rRNA (cytidine1409-2'-O)-methyltransferase